MALKTYRELKVWQKAMDLTVEIYRLTKLLPKFEIYGLSDQMRRAAISIPSNIAEGFGRNSTKEFIQFLTIARGSQLELETQVQICQRLGYFSDNEIDSVLHLCTEINKMLNVLIKKLAAGER